MAGQHRRDTAANIATVDPYLRAGELLLATDTGDTYIGDNLNPASGLLPFEPSRGSTLIGNETLAAASAQIDITIPDRDDLAKLEIWVKSRCSVAAAFSDLHMRYNNIATAKYDYQYILADNTTISPNSARGGTYLLTGTHPGNSIEVGQWSTIIIEILFPRKVGPWRTSMSRNGRAYSTGSGAVRVFTANGWLRQGMKIDTVNLFMSTGNFLADTQVMTLGWVDK